MNYCAGIGLLVDSARFMPANTLFRNRTVTKERRVECYELVLFLKNGGAAVINGHKYPITAGSMRFHRPGDRVYSYRFNEIYVVHFTVDDEKKGNEIFSFIPSFINAPLSEDEIHTFQRLITAWAMQDDFECILALWQLLEIIKAQLLTQPKSDKIPVTSMIKKYIADHYAQQITLTELAGQFHLHPVYLHRKFKKDTGMTPADYIKEVRLSNAKVLLLTSDLSIDEISERCGFCNTSYFIKVFKSQMAHTPHQFRNESSVQI